MNKFVCLINIIVYLQYIKRLKNKIMTNNSLTNNEILINAFKNETLISFRLCSLPHWQESNVKIVKINLDDCENKNFIFETSKGERYNAYSSNIFFN